LDWFTAPEGAYFNRTGAAAYSMAGASGWHVLGWAALAACVLAIVAGLALPLAAATHESPVLPISASIMASLAGGIAIIALLIQVILQPGPDQLVEVKAGWWLGLIACFGIAGGGWLAMRDERSPNARERPIETRPAPPGSPSPDVP
jgi:hypothetical protein